MRWKLIKKAAPTRSPLEEMAEQFVQLAEKEFGITYGIRPKIREVTHDDIELHTRLAGMGAEDFLKSYAGISGSYSALTHTATIFAFNSKKGMEEKKKLTLIHELFHGYQRNRLLRSMTPEECVAYLNPPGEEYKYEHYIADISIEGIVTYCSLTLISRHPELFEGIIPVVKKQISEHEDAFNPENTRKSAEALKRMMKKEQYHELPRLSSSLPTSYALGYLYVKKMVEEEGRTINYIIDHPPNALAEVMKSLGVKL